MKKLYISAGLVLFLAALGVMAYFVFFTGGETSYEIVGNSLIGNSRLIYVYTPNNTNEALIEINDQLIAEYPEDGNQQYLLIMYYDDRDIAAQAFEKRKSSGTNTSTETTINEGALPNSEGQEDLWVHVIASYHSATEGSPGELRRPRTGETIKRY